LAIGDNIISIINSLKLKNKENTIGREIITQSNIQSEFLTNYSSFASGLMTMLEKLLITDGYHAVTYRSSDNGKSDKYLRYTLKDPQFSEAFHIVQKPGGEFEYTLIDGFTESTNEDKKEKDEDEDNNVIYLG
jgi:hypothetical protein